jgi:hypothetical protein
MAADGETNAVRLSARTTPSNYEKLIAIAKDKGWLNPKTGKPNISRVLNFVIASFEAKKGGKRGRREDGQSGS